MPSCGSSSSPWATQQEEYSSPWRGSFCQAGSRDRERRVPSIANRSWANHCAGFRAGMGQRRRHGFPAAVGDGICGLMTNNLSEGGLAKQSAFPAREYAGAASGLPWAEAPLSNATDTFGKSDRVGPARQVPWDGRSPADETPCVCDAAPHPLPPWEITLLSWQYSKGVNSI